MRKLFILLSALPIVFLHVQYVCGETCQFIAQWGDQRPSLAVQLNKPRGVAVDKQGNVFISEAYNNRVLKYNGDGTLLGVWTTCNGSPINYPMEIAVDSTNTVYVAEMLNHRIMVLNPGGGCRFFGSLGTGNGQFERPISVAVDAADNLYVSDRVNRRIQKFIRMGSVRVWSATYGPVIAGYDNGGKNTYHPLVPRNEFDWLWGIAVFGDHIYVSDEYNSKIVRLDMSGNYITSWGSRNIGNGEFNLPAGIAVDGAGNVYVADIESHRVQVFDPSGTFLRIIGERGTGNGQLQFPSAVAIDVNNQWLYVTDDDNDRVVKFMLNGAYVDQWGCDSTGTTGLRYPTKIAVDNRGGHLYVVDSGNQRIRKLTFGLQEIGSWGSYGDLDSQFRFPVDAATDANGDMYVLDNIGRSIKKYGPQGTFLAKWDINFDPRSYLYGLLGITVDGGGNMYVADADTNRLYRLDAAGNLRANGKTSVGFYPSGVELDETSGRIYVPFFGNDTVQQFDMGGILTDSIGKDFLPGDSLVHPYDVAVAENGNILVTDTFNHRVVKFDSVGNYLTQWGSTGGTGAPGNEAGKFAMPYGVAVDKFGYVYVADTNNHRIQKFARVIFNDVPGTYWALTYINKLYDLGVTSGCGNGNYCPSDSVTRAQMAVFLEKVIHGSAFNPPSATGLFFDVPVSPLKYWAADWIEQLYSDGITLGCGTSPLRYCPDNAVTRAQMAVFLLKAKHGSAYTPPPATGTRFLDVKASDFAAAWIEQLAAEGITSGCGSGNYCPSDSVTRAQMAVFLTKIAAP